MHVSLCLNMGLNTKHIYMYESDFGQINQKH